MEKPEIERRFLVRPGFSEKDFPKLVRWREFHVVQTYLLRDGHAGSRRVREIWQERKSSKYFFTQKRSTKNAMTKMEDERQISYEEHQTLLLQADPSRKPIEKRRICFRWKKQDFELDIFSGPDRVSGLIILEIELCNEWQKVVLPPFLPIVAEITDAKGLSNLQLSKKLN